MFRRILEFISSTIFFIWAHWFAGPNLQAELYGMAIGLSVALAIEFFIYLYKDRDFLGLYWNCNVLHRNSKLRLTIAYLYKIEMQGKYLLVKSRNIPNTFQPVGGVYKYFHPEASTIFHALQVHPDNAIPNDEINECDLRIQMLQRKNIGKFLQWFFSGSNREIDPWREFYEELVAPGILSAQNFKYIFYEKVAEHIEPIHFDTHNRIDTFKYVDIYIPRFVTNKQKEDIRGLLANDNPEYIWATENEILNKITSSGKRIADHSYKIFHNKKLGR